jgi:uncharacterized protein YraI
MSRAAVVAHVRGQLGFFLPSAEQPGMRSMLKQSLIGVASALLLSSAAIADSSVVTTGNLNIRTGPGTGYHVIGVIPAGDAATVTSCLSDSSWCSVD